MNRLELDGLSIVFHRTVRVASKGANLLPASLGQFAVEKVADYREKCPEDYRPEDYFVAMWPGEALWMSFIAGEPKAIIVAAGRINAVTGEEMGKPDLKSPQNYVVAPPQPWLDGWKAPDNRIYQFAAASLGSGQTMEEQLTGKAEFGGLQIAVYGSDKKLQPVWPPSEQVWAGKPSKESRFSYSSGTVSAAYTVNAAYSVNRAAVPDSAAVPHFNVSSKSVKATEMGLGRGGEIFQRIYPDPYGLEVWTKLLVKASIHIISALDYKAITGKEPHPKPEGLDEYQKDGKPWFGLHDEHLGDAAGSEKFGKMEEVKEEQPKADTW